MGTLGVRVEGEFFFFSSFFLSFLVRKREVQVDVVWGMGWMFTDGRWIWDEGALPDSYLI